MYFSENEYKIEQPLKYFIKRKNRLSRIKAMKQKYNDQKEDVKSGMNIITNDFDFKLKKSEPNKSCMPCVESKCSQLPYLCNKGDILESKNRSVSKNRNIINNDQKLCPINLNKGRKSKNGDKKWTKEIRKRLYWSNVVVPNFVPKRDNSKMIEIEMMKYISNIDSKHKPMGLIKLHNFLP